MIGKLCPRRATRLGGGRTANLRCARGTVPLNSVTAPTAWPTGDSYAQWLRRALVAAREPGRDLHALFDSSTAEPTELLANVITRAFSPPVTSRYQSTFAGNQALVAALAARHCVATDRILPTAGATSALAVVYRAYLRPGDRVLVERPGFDLFDDLAASMAVHVDHLARGEYGSLDLDALAAAVRPGTRLVVLSDLHNPTGQPLSQAAMRAVTDVASDRGIDVLIDEVYREYARSPAETAAHIAPNVIAINSLTKVYGLSALRCGWIVADPSRMARLREVHARTEFASAKVTHAVGAMVLEEPERFEEHWRGLLAAARPVVSEAFSRWRAAGLLDGGLPEHGCIAFPRLIGIENTLAFSEWLAARCGVVVAPGEYFGAAGHVRIGFSHPPARLRQALDLLGDGLTVYRERGGSREHRAVSEVNG